MSKKVFELANEFGIGAIDLVEKLKANGLNIRNHMVTLSDEELSKALSILTPVQTETKSAVKKVIKKVVKKETTPEPTVAAATSMTPEKVEVPEAAAPTVAATPAPVAPVASASAGTVKRKVSVIRKKAHESDEDGNIIENPQYMETKETTHSHEDKVTSERIETTVRSEPAGRNSDSLANALFDKNKDYYKERMHTFTPIFTPPVKEGKKEDDDKKQPARNFTRPEAEKKTFVQGESIVLEDVEDTETEEEKNNKKRLGGLAAMVSTKKVRDITMIRAEEELKSYAVGIIGQAIYTPAKKKKTYSGPTMNTQITEVKESKRILHIPGGCTATELASKLSLRFDQVADQALDINLLLKKDDYLGVSLASKIAALYQYRVEDTSFKEDAIIQSATTKEKVKSEFPLRSPIIAIMGHVDHGKTSLLDYIRKAKVAAGEAGGITQHIGAYQVKVKDTTLTFLDTPGHAAFATMRQRGANVTDIVVLVVAADDGVMPQTKESIKYIQAAGCPMIVAMNKMDKEGANPDKVKQALMEFNVTPEEWGGDTQFVEVSALKGTGIDKLLESIQIQADVMDLRANPAGNAEAIVIESKIEVGRGPVATVLVQSGTLKKGDAIVVGETTGRARSLTDFQGKMVNEAGPSTPVQILGLEHPAIPGDILNVVKNEREALKIVENRINDRKALTNLPPKKLSLEDFLSSAQEVTGKKMLKLIVRADVQGSVEAIKQAVEALGNSEVGVEVLSSGVGPINDNDVLLAANTKGFILGFNMRPATTARKLAEDKGVDVKTYSIIYELINDVTLALEGMLTPERIEKYIGRATVKEIFTIPKIGTIAGASVIDGKIQRSCNIRLLRNGKIIHDGKLATLKRFKDEVKEVANGYECGIALENFNDVRAEDIFEAYIMEEKKRTLEPNTSL